MSLHERLRAIIGGAEHASPLRQRGAALDQSVGADLGRPRDITETLGGSWRDEEGARCFVVERRYEAPTVYGHDTVGSLADRLAEAADEASMVANGAPVRPPWAFLDLETTGLSGGAGTHAFLVGCGWFEADRCFVTRQFVLTRFADERALLAAVATELGRAGSIVSFNGKSFDAPVLETRYLFHRLQWPGEQLPHLDVLHPSRRFWRPSTLRQAQGRLEPGREATGSGRPELVEARDDATSCSLGALEAHILGARRAGDVPGFEIPARYFQFIRGGDARVLAPILEHNRLDLLALAGLTSRLLQLVRGGPDAARDGRETLALGRVYLRAGLDGRARQAFERALDRISAGPLRVEALRSLALTWRRARRYEAAAGCWRALLDVVGCPPHVAREAMEALAIHHEHRIRDLAAARAFALRGLGTSAQPTAALQHRLARLDRKIERGSTLTFQLSPES